MKQIMRIKFGSHLYGTETPSSDLDYKSIYIPSSKDILLQRVKQSINSHRTKSEGEKNLPGETDEEAYSVQRFLSLASEGQTVALDILFAPSWAETEPSTWEWRAIQANRSKLLTRRSGAFLGYCRQQANKYGIKGSRVRAAKEALGILTATLAQLGTTAKLSQIADPIEYISAQTEHMTILDIEGATDVTGTRRTVRHWEVCGRKMPYTQTIKSAHEVMARLVNEYGTRAKQAANNENIDWKALSHAVRVGGEALELLTNSHISFPRPNADHLKHVKLGIIPYTAVAEEIEHLLSELESAAIKSSLPDTPDHTWIDEFIYEIYRNAVLEQELKQ